MTPNRSRVAAGAFAIVMMAGAHGLRHVDTVAVSMAAALDRMPEISIREAVGRALQALSSTNIVRGDDSR